MSKPNVVFILADQHNAKVLGHKGHPDVKTPNLDKMAEEGVRFNNAVSQNPICTPSRVSFLSGQYCHNHGIYNLSGPQPNNLPNMLGYFRGRGYTTAAIGKIHCPEYWVEDQSDVFEETANCSIGGPFAYSKYIKDNNLVEEHKLSEGRSGVFGQCMDGYESPLPYRATPEGQIVDMSKKFMTEAKENGKPFIVHLSFPRPHQTYAPAKEFWDMYDEYKITMPPNWKYDNRYKAPHLKSSLEHQKSTAKEWTVTEPHTYDDGCKRKLRGYLGSISMVDCAVVEVIDFLKKNGLEENTIVVYSADHGDYACEHGLIEKAPGICSDAITRIPYIWKFGSNLKHGHVSESIVEAVDVFPTLCSLAGFELIETADGKDITSLLQGESKEVKSVGVTEFAWSKSIRKDNFRYVYYPKEMFADEYPEGFGELYDLDSDPWEMNNLYFTDEYKAKVLEMEKDLMDWLVTTTRVVGTNGVNMPTGSQAVERHKVRTNIDGKIHPDCLRNLDSKNYL